MLILKRYLTELLMWIKSIFFLFYWLLAHIYKSDFKNHITRINRSKTIDIIVNGPSFANQVDNVKDDGNEKCMVNFAANSPIFWELKPSYYCVSDPSFFKSVDKDENVKEFIDNIKRIDWKMTFYVTYRDYKNNIKNSEINKLPNIEFIPFHSTSFPYSFKLRKLAYFLFTHGQAMPNPTSVSVPVIMNMINAGYHTIQLYGYDQDWIHNLIVDNNCHVCLQDTHFYNEKGYLRPWMKNSDEYFKVHEVLRSQTELFETYWFIKEYVNSLGDITILNMSPSSLIDAFEKIKL